MATGIEGDIHLKIRFALQELNNDFCYHLDHGNIEELVDLFCEDANYSHGNRHSHGVVEIRDLFTQRQKTGVRTSRHIQTGMRFTIKNNEKASGTSVCMTFAEDLSPPVLSAQPHLVADFIDDYRYCADGRWRIEKRHIERIFVAADNKGPVGA